jgi:hypothetical protein
MEHSFPLIRRFAQMGMVMGLAIFVPSVGRLGQSSEEE